LIVTTAEAGELEQPFIEYTTLYVVFKLGETKIELEVCPPGVQLKVPPFTDGVAIRFAEAPGHIVALFTETVGVGFTTILIDEVDDGSELEHPTEVAETV
jgi:hypothetical protein